MSNVMDKVDEIYNDFWKEIVEDENGKLNKDQVKKELYDFWCVMQEVRKVYDEITFGRISKPNTKAEHVINDFWETIDEEYQRGYDEAKVEFDIP